VEKQAAHGCAEFLPVNLAIETEICGGKYELQKFHDVIYLQQSFISPFWMALQSVPYDVERFFDWCTGEQWHYIMRDEQIVFFQTF